MGNGKKVLLVVIGLLCLALTAFCGYFIGTKDGKEKAEKSFQPIKPIDSEPTECSENFVVSETLSYEAEVKVKAEEVKNQGGETLKEYLVLYKDGTFVRRVANAIEHIEYGNYVINGNMMTLNYIFYTGTGKGIYYSEKPSSVLEIRENSIVDNSYSNEISSVNGLIFRKNSSFSITNWYIKSQLKNHSTEDNDLVNSNM